MRYDRSELASGPKCFHCDCAAEAVWHAESSVHVCRSCAETVLPALIADAVWARAGHATVADFEAALSRVHAAYWRAVSARMANESRLKDKGDLK